MTAYLLLALTIGSEVIATASLKASQGFSRPLPSIIVVLGYGTSFYALSQVLKRIPLSVTYATWSAAGTVAIAIIGYLVWHEDISWPRVLGLLLVVGGVALLNK